VAWTDKQLSDLERATRPVISARYPWLYLASNGGITVLMSANDFATRLQLVDDTRYALALQCLIYKEVGRGPLDR